MSSTPGPREPATSTPARAPGSVRRTTTLDLHRPERGGGPLVVVGRGRDLATSRDGGARVLDAVELRVDATPDGSIASITSEPPVAELATLRGAPVRRGFRARIDAEPALDHDSVLYQLLDDLPVTSLVSGYGEMRVAPSLRMDPSVADGMADLCAGWQRGATMLTLIAETGRLPTPVGPPAPRLDGDDPHGWHDLPMVEPGTVRRRRRIDVTHDDSVRIDAMFRDTFTSWGGAEDVLHEYQLDLTVDASTWTVLAASAIPHVLPWPECPTAAASATRVVGLAVGAIRDHVSAEFDGVTTCTHLNDALRALAPTARLDLSRSRAV